MNELNLPEKCAMRLIRLCASPGKKIGYSQFQGLMDASGNSYHRIFSMLEAKGHIRYKERRTSYESIEIV